MKSKDWLRIGASAVTFLLGAFGGFLKGSAPPLHPLHSTNSQFAVGIASLLTLLVFLLIAAMVRTRNPRGGATLWFTVSAISIAVFLFTAWQYSTKLDRYQFTYPIDSGVDYSAGDQLQPKAAQVMRQNPTLTKTDLVAGFGGLPRVTQVWTEASINSVNANLSFLYIVFVVSIGSSLFAISHGLLSRTD